MLKFILGEQRVDRAKGTLRTPLPEQVYINKYPSDKKLRQQFIRGSISFLEQQFFKIIKNTVASNLAKANTGGTPSIRSFVRGYLNIKFKSQSNTFPAELVSHISARIDVRRKLLTDFLFGEKFSIASGVETSTQLWTSPPKVQVSQVPKWATFLRTSQSTSIMREGKLNPVLRNIKFLSGFQSNGGMN
jgi:hypothetical protein